MPRSATWFVAFFAALVFTSSSALALNKQGLAAPTNGDEETHSDDQNLTGYVFGGALVYNPSYAARPDNSGLALFRSGMHADLDLLGKHLTISYDGNVFTDRRSGSTTTPSEHDHIVGLLTRQGNFEVGAHYEIDSPADRPGDTQRYADLHGRAYFDLFRAFPALAHAMPNQRVTGFFTFAGFAYNPTYAARPDLTGLALFRLVGHAEIDLYEPWLTLSADFNFFTDRSHGLVPSELDTTVGLTTHLADFDVSIVGENDRPVDRPGISQSYVSAMLAYRFDVKKIIETRRAPSEEMETARR